MKKKILQETIDSNNSPTKKNINYYNNSIIIVFSWLTSMTLIISWTVSIFFFKTETNNLLIFINSLFTKKVINFYLSFSILTIIILGFGFIILGIVGFPFIFFKNNDFISLILVKIMLWISLFFIAGSILFISLGYSSFYKNYFIKNNILFFIIPWILVSFYFTILILSCLCFIKKSRQKKYMSLEMKPPYFQNEINQKTEPLLTQTNNDEQQIWTAQQIEEVWNKGEIVNDFNPQLYRKDYAGALMFWHNFIPQPKLNDSIESLNWTIVYERPITNGGDKYTKNLVPMNNNNAVTKGNNFPSWTTTTTYDSKKRKNIFKKKSWKYKEKNHLK